MKQATRRGIDATATSPILLVGLAAVTLLIAGFDYIELIPGFSHATASQPFHILHASHDVIAVALSAILVIRGISPKLGAGLIVLFMVIHAPYYYIGLPRDLPELVHLLVVGAFGLIGIAMMADRRRAYERIRQSEKRYRSLFDNMLEGLAYCRMLVKDNRPDDFVYLGVNGAFEKLTGLKDVVGRKVTEVIPGIKESNPELFETYGRVAATGLPESFETYIEPPQIWLSISVYSTATGYFVAIFDNITERKRMEEALRRTEENFRRSLDDSPLGISIVDPDGETAYANRAMLDIYGYTTIEELKATPGKKRYPQESYAEHLVRVQKRQRGEYVPSNYEISIVRKNGVIRHLEVFRKEVLWNGKPQFQVLYNDITERRRVEESLRESEERYRTLVDNALVGVFRTNLKGDILYVNDALVSMFGFYSAEEMMAGGATVRYKNQSDRAILIKELTEKGKVSSFGFESLTKTGEMKNIILNAVLEGDNISGIIIDVTERKRVEEELRRSHENFRRSLDDSPLPIRIYRAGGTTVYANLLFLELFGCDSIEEFNATPPEKRFTPESYGQHQQRKEARKRNGFVPSDYEGSIVRRNGEIRHLRVFRKEVLWNGESHFQHLCYDITERKQIQEQLMLADRMATIGELASGVAHELNNPLTSVIGFSQLLMERELPDDIKEDLGLVYSEAQRAAHIVKNLLTFARKHAPVRQLCQIHNILEDVLKLRAHDQKANNIEVNRRFASDLPEITVDYFQMQQVFLNIILNAEYFMAEAHHKGTLTITTKRFDNTVRISVADDGPGIAQEDLGKVFNPFFTMKEVGKGTGLGLSLCHGIVSEHGGSIYVRSQLGEGATFVVELPVNGDLVKREVPHG